MKKHRPKQKSANIVSTSWSTIGLGNSLNFIFFLDSVTEKEYEIQLNATKIRKRIIGVEKIKTIRLHNGI